MTDFSAAAVRSGFEPQAGKHNMASRAFEALRARHDTNRSAKTANDSRDLGFGDFLDIVNPLQHIPLVSDIYRSLTGDKISDSARVAGDALYGGPLGLVSGVLSTAIQAAEGENPVSALAEALGGGKTEDTTKTASLSPATDTAKTATEQQTSTDTPATTEKVAAAYRVGTAWRDEPNHEPPATRPVRQAAAQTATGPDAKTGETAGQPLPRLSPAAFNALLSAFGSPSSSGKPDMKTTGTLFEKQERKPAAKQPEPRLANADPAPVPPSGFAAAMADGLDKYRTLMEARGGNSTQQ